ncbi:MAG: ferritin-like domain-containing protein [Aquabacterium commune]|uniref:ferritin-like domain-containing protein n=2 Tax=Burkholderiales genera incertae sedis TaxID=224471 RepID=UPI001D91362B|nr:ferritin-like domain-containing protein [Aquabacterium sp.]MBT9610630.1 ferritin-like domain-containing protein [Aquabacterium sp.]
MPPGTSPRRLALDALLQPDPALKAQQARNLFDAVGTLAPGAWQGEAIALAPEELAAMPGRPARPNLVSATQVPSRSPFTLEGRAALLHAICHIEFNAINLALDAVWRYADMPMQFYLDWLRVASEEALHFGLLRAHLQSLGFDYGDFDAHDGLWGMCEKTRDDIVARMALVPRTLEARGLDATPLIQQKLTRAGDLAAVAILDTILRDEVGHVAIGNHWFHHLCQARGLDAIALYPQLVKQYDAPRMRPPFNEAARKAAGFTDAEMAFLLGLD